MLVSLIATFLVAACVGFFIWAGFRTVGRKAPGYLIPFSIGLTMLLFTIWNEYAWYARTLDGFPPEVKVVKSYDESQPWAPWTYIVPRVSRFVAVDLSKKRTNPAFPEFAIIETILVKRDQGPVKVQQMMDCATHRFADLPQSPVFGDNGLPQGVQWISGDAFPEIMAVVCAQ